MCSSDPDIDSDFLTPMFFLKVINSVKTCNTSVQGVMSKGSCKSSSLKKAIRYTSTAICAGGRA